MKHDVYFRCGDCGARIQEFDGKNYTAAKEPKPWPLRRTIENRKKIAGRPLCDACWEREIRNCKEISQKGSPSGAEAPTGDNRKKNTFIIADQSEKIKSLDRLYTGARNHGTGMEEQDGTYIPGFPGI